MKPDILTRKDIEQLVNEFYGRVKTDAVIGAYFSYMSNEKWEKHLQKMYGFWENAVFFTGNYEGNPMNVHKHIHLLMPINAEAFNQWVALFKQTTDDLFEGVNAEAIKLRASNIAKIMQIKILG